MLLLEDFYAQKILVPEEADEPQNVTFIDFSSFQISFTPTYRANQVVIAPGLSQFKKNQKESAAELHPFLR